MIIKKAEFIKSSVLLSQCPPDHLPEYAMIGRSNVGKSSLINMITNHSKLAQTSSKPGKTQTINHFNINDSWYLVDLPGYGWAKVSENKKDEWKKMINTYLKERANLMCVCVLIDSRHSPQEKDFYFIKWLGMNEIPFVIIFTKTDKQSALKTEQNINLFKKALLELFEEFPQYFVTSSEKGIGKEGILNFITETNKSFINPNLKETNF
jgi:GTP-binding protein